MKSAFLFRLLTAFAIVLIIARLSVAQTVNRTLPTKAPLVLTIPVQDKNFYLLSLIERDPRVKKAIAASDSLQKLQKSKIDRLAQCFTASKTGNIASIADLLFTDTEIVDVEKTLTDLYKSDAAVRNFADTTLRRSGVYQKYADERGDLLLAHAWHDCALGINNIVSVYGLGNSGRSPQIDSVSYDAKSFVYGALIHNILGANQEEATPDDPFYQPALRFALSLLEANRRDEAGRFEPMEQGENRAAYRRIASMDWGKYPYCVILIPGYGPEEPDVHLSPVGKLSLGLAVRRFKAGKAPFIVVSGGFVHPKQTPYCEAIEMKRSLIRDFGIPENAILIDPHARHTTTNLRNTARIIYRYGIPFDKPGLIVTNTFQSADIESKAFFDRCQKIFGYQPHKVLKRLSPFDLEFLPTIDSLYADPIDPLDP